MDKQEATEFIQRRLDNGYSPAEITQLLSQQLNAPEDMVERFVAQVAANYQPTQPVPQETWQAEPPSSNQPPAQVDFQQAEQPDPVNVLLPEMPIQAPTPTASARQIPPAASKKDELLDDPELAKAVWSMLRKGRKRSDVVMWVCEKTGAEWTLAQRLVAQVQVEHHGEMTNINRLEIIGSMAFVVGGLALVIVGIASITPLVRGLIGVDLGMPVVVKSAFLRPENSLGSIILGIALMIGGSVRAFLIYQSRR
jgi:hypothetical protein